MIYIVTGRRIEDYINKGDALPEGAFLIKCACCSAPLAISSSGGAGLTGAKTSGKYTHCGAVCRECIRKVKQVRGLEVSEHGAQVLADGIPGSVELLDELLSKVIKYDKNESES